EYVIFLLPESKARLTSPAGASRGAFLVAGEDVIVPEELTGLFPSAAPQGRDATTAAGGGRVPYRTVRDSILKTLAGAPPPRRMLPAGRTRRSQLRAVSRPVRRGHDAPRSERDRVRCRRRDLRHAVRGRHERARVRQPDVSLRRDDYRRHRRPGPSGVPHRRG